MLIYEKRTHDASGNLVVELYGNIGTAMASTDQKIVLADATGTDISPRPVLKATYVSNLAETGGVDVLRLSDGKEIIVGIKDAEGTTHWVIGKPTTTVVSEPAAESNDEERAEEEK